MAGGMEWLRWYHGSVTDPKFQLVARNAGVRLGDVIAVWAYLLEQASAAADRGAFGTVDCETLDCLIGCPDGTTAKILNEMQARRLIDGTGRVVAWDRRQPKRERDNDYSTKRVRAFRDRERHETQRSATLREETAKREEKREEKREGEKHAHPRFTLLEVPEEVSPQTWQDWLELRRAKKAPVTETVLNNAKAEAAKAGMPLQRFLEIWCMRGSQGLQADWLREHERRNPADIARTTVPGSSEPDPTLHALKEHKGSAPSPEIRERIAVLTGRKAA